MRSARKSSRKRIPVEVVKPPSSSPELKDLKSCSNVSGTRSMRSVEFRCVAAEECSTVHRMNRGDALGPQL
eukprot:1982244-Pyramimonas_sp.AAC.1